MTNCTSSTISQLIKFFLVGIVNTLVGASVMFALYNFAQCSYWLASACNYIAGGIVSFFLNKFFTFKNDRKSPVQVLLFVLNVGACYLVAYAVARNLVRLVLRDASQSMADNIAMLCGMCLYTALNYIGQRFIVFADKTDKSKQEAE